MTTTSATTATELIRIWELAAAAFDDCGGQ